VCVFDPIWTVFSAHSHSAQGLDIETLTHVSDNLIRQSQIVGSRFGHEPGGLRAERSIRTEVLDILRAKQEAQLMTPEKTQDKPLGVHRVHMPEAGS